VEIKRNPQTGATTQMQVTMGTSIIKPFVIKNDIARPGTGATSALNSIGI
jgi:hypothetical protein